MVITARMVLGTSNTASESQSCIRMLVRHALIADMLTVTGIHCDTRYERRDTLLALKVERKRRGSDE